MGFNKLRNLTEGMLRGLGKLQYLYLQANLIETVSPNAFWEGPNLENIDLSMNRYSNNLRLCISYGGGEHAVALLIDGYIMNTS